MDSHSSPAQSPRGCGLAWRARAWARAQAPHGDDCREREINMVRTLVVLAVLGGVGFVFYAWATSGPETEIRSKETNDKGSRPPSTQKERDDSARGGSGRQQDVR